MKPEHRSIVIEEIISRICADIIKHSHQIPLETVINDTIYLEKKRLGEAKPSRANTHAIKYWKQITRELKETLHLPQGLEVQKKLLETLVRSFAQNIVGNFNPKVYHFTTKALPILLNLLLNAISPRIIFSHFPHRPDLSERLIVKGEVALLQSLAKIGTIILVPTHSSHMDSIVVGWTLHKLGLPPFIYGAANTLFKNWFAGYFMSNLGAYKVDRNKAARLYKDVLKEYTTCCLEFGYHNLFFPGGTRSRSGAIETHLKLGLLGSGLRAYINNLKNQKPNPNIFIVPCTISYQLVLEAERLIEEELKQTGKAEYIEEDEFSHLYKFLSFLSGILRLDSRIYVRMGQASDLFGNIVDSQGISYDNRGRIVDISRYIMTNNNIVEDSQRDMQYTRELSDVIYQSYLRNNVVMSTNLVAYVVHEILHKHNPEMNLYRLLRNNDHDETLPLHEVYEVMERVYVCLKNMEAQHKICIDDTIRDIRIDQIFSEALEHFGIYHTKKIMERKGDNLELHDRNLIYYYHNRLIGYDLEKEI